MKFKSLCISVICAVVIEYKFKYFTMLCVYKYKISIKYNIYTFFEIFVWKNACLPAAFKTMIYY